MNRHSVLGVMVMAATLVGAQAVYAAPVAFHTPVNAMYASGKMVKFTLLNDSKAPMKVKVGDAEMTLAPGKPVDVKLAVGQQIVNEEATATNKAGVVLATAIAELDGATISVH
jgi:hypothetical protein